MFSFAPFLRRRVRRDEKGSAAVEMGIAAPLFLMFVVGTLELGMVMFVNVLMESSLRVAARWGVTGQEPEAGDRLGTILEIIEDRTGGLLDMSEANVTVKSYPTFGDLDGGEDFVDGNGNGEWDAGETFKDCNGNGQWDDDRGTNDDPGGARDVVVYRIEYDWPLFTNSIAEALDTDGTFPLVANVVVRNEPWDQNNSANQTCDSS
jgi:hypothetical protein